LALNYTWASPKYMDDMYCDGFDHHGILYWYNIIENHLNNLKENNK